MPTTGCGTSSRSTCAGSIAVWPSCGAPDCCIAMHTQILCANRSRRHGWLAPQFHLRSDMAVAAGSTAADCQRTAAGPLSCPVLPGQIHAAQPLKSRLQAVMRCDQRQMAVQ